MARRKVKSSWSAPCELESGFTMPVQTTVNYSDDHERVFFFLLQEELWFLKSLLPEGYGPEDLKQMAWEEEEEEEAYYRELRQTIGYF